MCIFLSKTYFFQIIVTHTSLACNLPKIFFFSNTSNCFFASAKWYFCVYFFNLFSQIMTKETDKNCAKLPSSNGESIQKNFFIAFKYFLMVEKLFYCLQVFLDRAKKLFYCYRDFPTGAKKLFYCLQVFLDRVKKTFYCYRDFPTRAKNFFYCFQVFLDRGSETFLLPSWRGKKSSRNKNNTVTIKEQ